MGKAIALATPVFFLLIGIELLAARWRGAHGIYRFNDAINSLSLGVLSQVASLFMRGLAIGIYVIVFEHVALGTWPRDAWWAWALAIVFYDFCYYWNHRLGHESAMFWASHVVHHQSQRYNLSTALRQSSSGVLLGWVFYVPMAIAGVPPEMFAVAAVVDLLYQYWIHTELIGKLGWFDRWFASPSNHRVHHAVNDRYIDRNYGGIFMHLGPPLRHVRRGVRDMHVRHACSAQFLGSALGEPRSLCSARAQVGALRTLARQAAHLVQASGLAAAAAEWSSNAQA